MPDEAGVGGRKRGDMKPTSFIQSPLGRNRPNDYHPERPSAQPFLPNSWSIDESLSPHSFFFQARQQLRNLPRGERVYRIDKGASCLSSALVLPYDGEFNFASCTPSKHRQKRFNSKKILWNWAKKKSLTSIELNIQMPLNRDLSGFQASSFSFPFTPFENQRGETNFLRFIVRMRM